LGPAATELRQRKVASTDSDYRADDEAGDADNDDKKAKDKPEVTWGKTPSGQGKFRRAA
jgi:hypothetical protein